MGQAARRHIDHSVASQPATESIDDAQKLLSIGQVLTRLVTDFPDVTPSKIRFLEERGLVSPQRTESGYRKFGPADVDRLRLVLSLQRDHYLPLKVIRQYVDEIDAGESPMLPGIAHPLSALDHQADQQAYSRAELIEITHADAQLVRDAVSVGLLPTGSRFDQKAREVLSLLVSLKERGIEPRHLRGVKASIDREIGLVEGAISGFRRDVPEARAQAANVTAEVIEALVDLKRTLLERAVQQLDS